MLMTKKFILLAVGACLIAGSTFAAQFSPVVKNMKGKKTKTQFNFEPRSSHHESNIKKTPAKASEVITEAKGSPIYYYQNNDLLMYGAYYENYGNVTSLFFTDDNEVYFYDFLPEAGFGSYVIGNLSDGVITLELPQMVYYYDDYGYGFELSLLHLEDSGQYIACEGNAQFTMYDDGDIILDLPGEEYGEYVLGLIMSDDKSDAELCYTGIVFSPLEEQPETLPENIETENYYINDGLFGHPVQVGFDSEYLYMEGLEYMLPEWTVIKAELQGDKAIIKQDQFVGVYYVYLNYTKCVVNTPAGYIFADADAVVTLEIDRENKVITYAEGSPLLCINADPDELYELAIYNIFDLKVQNSFNGIPENPNSLRYYDTIDFYGFYDFKFFMSNISTEGNVLNNDYLYYKIYIDGEPYEFVEDIDTGEYYGLGTMTDIPYLFANGNEFYSIVPYSKEVGIYIDGFETIGVQAFYDYEGVLTESALVTLNLTTGDITEEGGTESGIEMIENSQVVKSEYFDLNGQRINHPEKGIYIVRKSLNNGSTITRKLVRR